MARTEGEKRRVGELTGKEKMKEREREREERTER